MSSLPRKLSLVLVVLLLALAVFRAKMQSFTIDEAFTYNIYIDQRPDVFLRTYDACYHVLHTLLTKCMRYLLGTSELVLRLGSLIGALIYMTGARKLVLLWFGSGWMHLVGLAAMTLNPLLMDFFVAARGYGLALGLFLWALYFLCRYLGDPGQFRLLWRGGILTGLSIAANLTMAVPALAMSIVLLILLGRARMRLWLDQYAGPALVTAFVLLVVPLSKAKAEHFYYGTDTAADAVRMLWEYSLEYEPERSAIQFIEKDTKELLIFRLLPAVTVLISAAGIWALARVIKGSTNATDIGLALISSILIGSIALLGAAHWLIGMRLPYGRTGLYFIVLFMACLILLTSSWLRSAGPIRLAGYGASALTGLLIILYIAQLNTDYFAEWRSGASTDNLVTVMTIDRERRGQLSSVKVGASMPFAHSVEYYRKRRRLRWIDAVLFENLDSAPIDYYMLSRPDAALIQQLKLKVLYRDTLSGAVLARRS